jgi:hypothetical protein
MVGKIDPEITDPNLIPASLLKRPIILWPVWVLSTAITTAFSRVGVTTLQNIIPGDNLPVDPLIIGLVVGLVQWLILRKLLPVSFWWIAASGLWILAEFLVFAFSVPGAFLGGLVVGAAQWLVLKNRLPAAGLWVLVSTLGWGLAALLATSSQSYLNAGYTTSYVIFHTLVATSTGGGLIMLLDKNKNSQR